MKDGMSDAWKLANGKVSIPSELRTAEWAILPQWLRERSFYMAGVHQAEILDEFRSEAQKIAAGQTGLEESRKKLEQFLTGTGYTPLPGQAGTIKDLSSMRRMQVSLRTNVDLLQGWGMKNRGLTLGAQINSPAWELVRVMPRTVPRQDWPERFQRAGGTLYNGRMIALKTSPVWQELGNGDADSMGVDYPPFAWGSGMGWRRIRRAEAVALGVIPAGWTPAPSEPLSSPNESLEMTPKISERALRDELARRMRGMAEWQGEKLVFTDPNGTRRMAPEKLVEVWSKGMPDAFHDLPGEGLMQVDAAVRWLGDHEAFRDQNDRNAWEDLIRLANRIESRPVERLWRGMSMGSGKLSKFLRDVGKEYSTRNEFPLESWTESAAAATAYARTGGSGWAVILEVASPKRAADFTPLVRAFSGQVSKQPTPPLVTESEWVYTAGRKFTVLVVRKNAAERTVHLILEELP